MGSGVRVLVMAIELSLKWDQKQLKALRGAGLERAITRAVSKAGGDAIRAMRAEANRQVRARKRMKAGKVTKGLRLNFPRGARHIDDLVWRVDVSGEPVQLFAYPNRQVKRGVSVAVNVGKRTIVKGAFIAKMSSGRIGVFVRESDAKWRAPSKGSKRKKSGLPIRELFSSRISDVIRDSGAIPQMHGRGQSVFNASFSRLLPLEIGKAKK